MERSKSADMFGLALVSGLLGAGLALLFAPRSGKETRQKIRNQTQDLERQAQVHMLDAREAVEKNIQDARDLKRRLTEALARPDQWSANDSLDSPKDMPGRIDQSSVLSTWEEEV